jgi:hypothetical protein
MPRTLADVDADLRAYTEQVHTTTGEDHAIIAAILDALLEERLRLRGPLRPSTVLARR